MATINKPEVETTISSRAIGLLECFTNGLDEFVYRLAARRAIQRSPSSTTVEVTVDDLKAAAGELVEILGNLTCQPM